MYYTILNYKENSTYCSSNESLKRLKIQEKNDEFIQSDIKV